MATKFTTAQLIANAAKSKAFAMANRKALMVGTATTMPGKPQVAAAAAVFGLKPSSNRAVAAALWAFGGATQTQVLAATGYVQRNTYKALAAKGHKLATNAAGVITLRPGGKGAGAALTVLAAAMPALAPTVAVAA